MQTQAARISGVLPFKARRGRVQCRRYPAVVRAAYEVSGDVDLRSMLQDALKTPEKTGPKPLSIQPTAPAPATSTLPPTPAPAEAASVPDMPSPVAEAIIAPVPGTEVLPPPPTPSVPVAPSQGMDIVVEQLKEQGVEPAGASETSEVLSSAAQSAADSLGSTADALSGAVTDATSAVSDAVTDATSAVSGAVTDATSAVSGAASSAASAVSSVVGESLSDAADAASAVSSLVGSSLSDAAGVASGAGAAASAAASQAADAVGAAAAQVGSSLQAALQAAQQLGDGATAQVGAEVSIVKENLSSLTSGVTSGLNSAVAAVNDATAAANSQLSSAVGSVLDQLPPELREAVAAAGAAAGAAATGALDGGLDAISGQDPGVAAVALGLALGLPAFWLWGAVFASAGKMEPAAALEMLQTEDAVLVDLRTEAQRLEQGVPELKRGALGKGAAVPPFQLLPSVSRRVRDPQRLALDILAVQIASLTRVNPGSTRVVLMDAQGERAKAVARALGSAGVRQVYVMEGGFKAWAAAGLAVDGRSGEYDASPLALVGDVAESVVEGVSSKLGQTQTVVAAAAALGGIAFVAFNLKLALRFVGVVGVELTILIKALSYESPQDFLDEVTGAWRALNSAAAAPARLVSGLQRRLGEAGER